MKYELTEKQQEGLNICLERFKNGEPYTIIAGYAGTGKSYLVNAIVDAFDLDEYEVAYACYTGKAALVLQNQGKNATTLHKLLYYFKPDGYGGFIKKPKEKLDVEIQLIIVDEISMCPREMWNLLLKHHIYIIGLGDPFQLPPIGDELHLLDKPHVFLTEVMRQALDSDIIKYSMLLREGENLPIGINGNDIMTLSKNDFSTGMIQWADQILCAKNVTRKSLNNEARALYGREGVLAEEEKVICTRNYWETANDDGDCLVNGTIGQMHFVTINGKKIHGTLQLENKHSFEELSIDYKLLTEGTPTVKKDRRGKIIPNPYIELEYGYAITVHKAQGSQFAKVLVYDDYWKTGEEYRRWLYTAITRAIHKVVVLM